MIIKYREKEKAKIILSRALTNYAIAILFKQICHICLSAINGLTDFY